MPRRALRPGWIDLLVVAATSIAFAAAVYSQGHSRTFTELPSDAAIQALADELGVTADELRQAARKAPPPPPGIDLTDEQRAAHSRALAAALALPPAKVDAVFARHRSRPGPPRIAP